MAYSVYNMQESRKERDHNQFLSNIFASNWKIFVFRRKILDEVEHIKFSPRKRPYDGYEISIYR